MDNDTSILQKQPTDYLSIWSCLTSLLLCLSYQLCLHCSWVEVVLKETAKLALLPRNVDLHAANLAQALALVCTFSPGFSCDAPAATPRPLATTAGLHSLELDLANKSSILSLTAALLLLIFMNFLFKTSLLMFDLIYWGDGGHTQSLKGTGRTTDLEANLVRFLNMAAATSEVRWMPSLLTSPVCPKMSDNYLQSPNYLHSHCSFSIIYTYTYHHQHL